MTIEFPGAIWHWKGPAPHYFVTLPKKHAIEIRALEKLVTYGWGMIPVSARISKTKWTTAWWPKD